MLKNIYFILIISITFHSCAQKQVILYSKQNKIIPRINIPLSADKIQSHIADLFNENFKNLTGEFLPIERSNGLNKNYNYIVLSVNPTQKESFCIYKNDDNIIIQGTTNQNLAYGAYEFFKRYTTLNFENKNKEFTVSEVFVPKEFSYCSSPQFEYREPYFSSNFNLEYQYQHKTNYLELEWGIWGHNLPKILKKHKVHSSSYAQIDKKRNENQFCFTSDTLFKYVDKEVQTIFDSDHALNKYMILPNDNALVCACSTCKAVGNTKNNAAPAVFTFLNKLAKKHKKLSFFTAAYISVQEIPKFKPLSNVGIFYSTIDIQKGIPIEESKYFEKFQNDIKRWQNYLNTVYIWDYTVNFDNYFDIYPNLKTTQKNLKLYKKLGIKGVFLHGSEYHYSSFQGLKSAIFAQLLWNPRIDIDKEITAYFKNKYSNKLADILTNYYVFIDNSFLISKKELGIYSGINSSVKKYLDPKVFFKFYDEFDSFTQDNKFDKDFLKIATALTFLKLEIMRDYGYGQFGFAYLNNKKEIIIKNEVGALLDKLNIYSRSVKLNSYNERDYAITDYIQSWRNTNYRNHKRKHLFFKKPFKVISDLDEDYTNTKVLNDGAFGLKDYNTNWHISSIDNLTLQIAKKEIGDSERIIFSFLQDTKHAIYYPSAIEIYNSKNKIIKKLTLPPDNKTLDIKEVSIELPNKFDDDQLTDNFTVKIVKKNIAGKNTLACDEIIFN